tara:strand:+ start:877 stop:2283 length:1407 start_codon:yes stop_codon:yes gene_type:complete
MSSFYNGPESHRCRYTRKTNKPSVSFPRPSPARDSSKFINSPSFTSNIGTSCGTGLQIKGHKLASVPNGAIPSKDVFVKDSRFQVSKERAAIEPVPLTSLTLNPGSNKIDVPTCGQYGGSCVINSHLVQLAGVMKSSGIIPEGKTLDLAAFVTCGLGVTIDPSIKEQDVHYADISAPALKALKDKAASGECVEVPMLVESEECDESDKQDQDSSDWDGSEECCSKGGVKLVANKITDNPVCPTLQELLDQLNNGRPISFGMCNAWNSQFGLPPERAEKNKNFYKAMILAGRAYDDEIIDALKDSDLTPQEMFALKNKLSLGSTEKLDLGSFSDEELKAIGGVYDELFPGRIGGHQVTLNGYDYDESTGKVTFHIKNTWRGYLDMEYTVDASELDDAALFFILGDPANTFQGTPLIGHLIRFLPFQLDQDDRINYTAEACSFVPDDCTEESECDYVAESASLIAKNLIP